MKNIYLPLIFFFVTLVLISTLAFVQPVLATVTCTTQYGGGQTCVSTGALLVNKKVWDPDGKVFVDNLGLANHIFQQSEEVIFNIDIKNVGDATLDTVNFTDTLPSFLQWSSEDPLSLTISSLTPGQTVTKQIRVVVLATPGRVCPVNTVTISSPQGGSDTDTAQLCVGKNVLGVTTVPKTGPEMSVLALLPGLAGIGLYLKKFNSKGVKS